MTSEGVLEARVAGQMLSKSGMLFDEVHTSLLRRSIRTTNLALMELGQEYIPVYKHWRLNERNYGDLVGKDKKQVVMEHGAEQVKVWRRSFDTPPPPMADSHEYHPARDPRYRLVSRIGISRFSYPPALCSLLTTLHFSTQMLDKIPKSESLFDTMKRSSVYWDKMIAPALYEGKTILVVGHENNLRSLVMRLEGIPPEDIINLSLPRAVPLAYRLDEETLKPLDREDGKLDEATGLLRGTWLGGDDAVAEILERDSKQVYDTNIQENLELGSERDSYNKWMNHILGESSPYHQAKGDESVDESLLGSTPAVLDEQRNKYSNNVCDMDETSEEPVLKQNTQHVA